MDNNGYVALSEKVTATFYDGEHEEWTQQTVTIADVLDSVCDVYTVLPSVQQKRPTGYWMKEDGIFICSCCKSGYEEQPTLMGKPMFEWCPVCGAKMEALNE